MRQRTEHGFEVKPQLCPLEPIHLRSPPPSLSHQESEDGNGAAETSKRCQAQSLVPGGRSVDRGRWQDTLRMLTAGGGSTKVAWHRGSIQG